MQGDFSVGKFKRPAPALFHPESMLARKPWLTQGHRHLPLVVADATVFYVLYENPADYPNKFVLRCWRNQTADPNPLCVCTTHQAALAHLPKRVVCLGRNMGDDPVIKDVWMAANKER